MRLSARRRAAALVPVVLLVALAGCTAGGDPAPTTGPGTSTATGTSPVSPSPSAASEGTSGAVDLEKLVADVASAAAIGEPVATAKGTVLSLSLKQEPAELGVFRVEAGTGGTRLIIGLKAPAEVTMTGPALSLETWDIADVAVIDPGSGTILKPYNARHPESPTQTDAFCACSDYAKSVGPRWMPLYALVPALDAATTTVTVRVPGFPDVTDVPVTRG